MRISEIEDKGLRELAELRRDERDRGGAFEDYKNELGDAFDWYNTLGGIMAWHNVNHKKITTLEQMNEFIASEKAKAKTPTLECRIKALEEWKEGMEVTATSAPTHTVTIPAPSEPKQGDTVWVRDFEDDEWEKVEYGYTWKGKEYSFVCIEEGKGVHECYKYMTTINPNK